MKAGFTNIVSLKRVVWIDGLLRTFH